MTDRIEIREWRPLLGLVLTMPMASVLVSGCLYLIFHWWYPLNLIETVLDKMGLHYWSEGVLYTLFFSGPVFAFCLNAGVISRMRFETTNEKGICWAAIRENWFSLAVLFLSSIVLITLIWILLFMA